MRSDATEKSSAVTEAHKLVRGRSVAFTGRLASMTREDFCDVVESLGGTYSNGVYIGRGLGILVVGQREWPLTRDGQLTTQLRKVRLLKKRERTSTIILSEDQFLDVLGLLEHREQLNQLFSISSVCEILGVPRQRVREWVTMRMIEPTRVEHGVWYFDFQKVSAAKTLTDLTKAGVTPGRIRRSLEQLRAWMPEAQEPLRQLAAIESGGKMLVRLDEGSLAEPDGQLRMEFGTTQPDAPPMMRLVSPPTTAAHWFEQGLEQEKAGALCEAAASYREALLLGGPDADVVFCLANALRSLGKGREAVERYLQAVEITTSFVDAWNNLGLTLAELDRLEEASFAFRKALEADPENARAHYNLADTLDELGRRTEAEPHWRAYLLHDIDSQWAEHARARLA